jgi:chemotaxis protein MotA
MARRLLFQSQAAGGEPFNSHSKDLDMRTTSGESYQPYSRGPLAGAIFGVAIMLSPVVFSAHGFLVLFSLAGLVIVVGGVVATVFMSFQANDVHKALRAIPAMLREPRVKHLDLTQDMHDILRWVRLINSGGLSGLRASLDEDGVKSPFVNYGLNMVLSEYRPEDVRAMMETAAEASYDHDCIPVDVLRAMTSHAPAFGMIGTLVGMIAMLCDLNDSIASTGSTLAVAFLSTLYGVVSARMIYMPAAARLQQEVDGRQGRHTLITEGMVMLARGETASHIQDRLNGFLRPEQRDYFDAIDGSDTVRFTPTKAAINQSGGRQPALLGASGS